MEKTIWLSYDLDIRGDYENLFSWLDRHDAKECGDGIATFKYDVESHEILAEKLTKDLATEVSFKSNDRIYIVFQDENNVIKGRFIIGNRKKSPWQGYSQLAMNVSIEDY